MLAKKHIEFVSSSFDWAPHLLPESLFHYTTELGSNGILSENRLHLCDAFKTNDKNEVIGGLAIFNRLLAETNAFGIGAKRQFILRRITEGREQNHLPRVFFASFSSTPNDPALFNEYGQKGRGVMFGFSARSLANELVAADSGGMTTSRTMLAPAIYDDPLKEKILAEIIGSFGPIFSSLYDAKILNDETLWVAMMHFLGQTYQAVARFKEKDRWGHEEEIRLFVPLMTKVINPEVGNEGLRRPFRRHGTEKEFLRLFRRTNPTRIPRQIAQAQFEKPEFGLALKIERCLLGAEHNDNKFVDLFNASYPHLVIERADHLRA